MRLLHSRFIRHLHRCACPDRGLIEWAESPPPVAEQFESATIFGASLSSTFMQAPNTATQVVTVVLIILMSATTFTTPRISPRNS